METVKIKRFRSISGSGFALMDRLTKRLTIPLAAMIVIAFHHSSGGSDNSQTPTEPGLNHWAFKSITRPSVPTPRKSHRVSNPIDSFLLARLESTQLGYSTPATKHELLRRVTFDLTGLPPGPEDISSFVNDTSPLAYERLVERLLSSPHYGESWARKWLDLVRYAETAGFNADPLRPLAYQYRDYVIQSLNTDKPYDQFVQEQIAGDELWPSREEALIATGYNLLWPDESNASDVLLARQDALNDLTRNVGAVFLGLSIGCAQCHDHKFDPLLQTDFYQLQAFFAGIVPVESVVIGNDKELLRYREQIQNWQSRTDDHFHQLHAIESKARAKAAEVKRMKFPEVVLQAIDTSPQNRTALQHQLAFWSERQIILKEEELLAVLTKDQQGERTRLKTLLTEFEKHRPVPPKLLTALASVEISSAAPVTNLLSGGNYTKPLQRLEPGFPRVLIALSNSHPVIQSPRSSTSGRRTALARWLTHRSNPLTARVMVNRIWQGHFGQGLVSNANDFGTQTPAPLHPELLDWLATEFIQSNWSIKTLHRLIVTSSVYRQSSHAIEETESSVHAEKRDPENQLYWHFPQKRLPAESIRDAILMTSGIMNRGMSGPGIKPPLPPNFSTRHGWDPSTDKGEHNRRSVYIHAKRNLPYPILKAFDLPDSHESCAKRSITTVSPQALLLLNSPMILEFSQAFAQRILQDRDDSSLESIVAKAFLLAFCRPATEQEKKAALSFLKDQVILYTREKKEDRVGIELSVRDFCHALFNSNEFIYID